MVLHITKTWYLIICMILFATCLALIFDHIGHRFYFHFGTLLASCSQLFRHRLVHRCWTIFGPKMVPKTDPLANHVRPNICFFVKLPFIFFHGGVFWKAFSYWGWCWCPLGARLAPFCHPLDTLLVPFYNCLISFLDSPQFLKTRRCSAPRDSARIDDIKVRCRDKRGGGTALCAFGYLYISIHIFTRTFMNE